ncbi:hypothetical protein [Azospirillum thermophilum]|nr:hypothetical protein [Azospirillum thermophilum]
MSGLEYTEVGEFPQRAIIHGDGVTVLTVVHRRGDVFIGRCFVHVPTQDGCGYHLGDLGYEATSDDLADVRRAVGGLALTLVNDHGLFEPAVEEEGRQ